MEKAHPLAKNLSEQVAWQDKKLGNQPVKVLSWWVGNFDSLEYIKAPHKLRKQYCKDQGWSVDDMCDVNEECWNEFKDQASVKGFIVRNSDS